MNERFSEQIKARIIPAPQSVTVSGGVFKVVDGAKIIVESPASAETAFVEKFFCQYFHAAVKTVWNKCETALPQEGYALKVDSGSCTISAADRQSTGHALKTLRQLAESERGVLRSELFQLPCVEIRDFPETHFRGIHLCWFPETPAHEIEKQLRLAAWYKFNYCVLESWGVIRCDSHPEFCWEEFAVEKPEIRRLVALGKELGITLIPQFNIFGHAAQARCGTGKHVLLNRHPEYAPLYEPDGWSWCLSNPETRRYLTDIVTELHELFDDPPFFHAGCDEAYNAGSCSLCAEDLPGKLSAYLNYFHDLLKARGARMMMWHDMLLDRADPRWNGYIVCGSKDYDGLLSTLPDDMIICDWQYGYPGADGKEPSWATSKFFKAQGFDVLVCPWLEPQGTLSLGKCAAEEKLFGVLQTTWHRSHESHPVCSMFAEGAHSAWSPHILPGKGVCREFMNMHLRRICTDMGLTEYTQFGTDAYQVSPAPHQP